MQCPVCEKPMWDNRGKKRNPKAPDFRCKDENCKYSLNPDTGEYEPGDFTTGVWLKKEVDTWEKEIKESIKPKPIIKTETDPYVEGKEKNTTLICRTNLMCEIVKGFSQAGGLNDTEVKLMFNSLWQEIDK